MEGGKKRKKKRQKKKKKWPREEEEYVINISEKFLETSGTGGEFRDTTIENNDVGMSGIPFERRLREFGIYEIQPLHSTKLVPWSEL